MQDGGRAGRGRRKGVKEEGEERKEEGDKRKDGMKEGRKRMTKRG